LGDEKLEQKIGSRIGDCSTQYYFARLFDHGELGYSRSVYDPAFHLHEQFPLPPNEGTGNGSGSEMDAWHGGHLRSDVHSGSGNDSDIRYIKTARAWGLVLFFV